MNLLYVTSQTDEEIYVFGIGNEGDLSLVQRLSIPGGPAALAFAPNQKMVYAGLRNEPGIASLVIDRATGRLASQDYKSLPADPCFLAIDHTGQYLFAAYFQGAAVSVSAIEKNGSIGSDLQWIDTVRGAHCVRLSFDNRFVFVPHLSNSSLYQYRFDADDGRLEPNNPARLEFPEGTGTRHLTIHPNGKWAYTSNELVSSVSALIYDAERGIYSEMQTLSTLPVGFDGDNSCAQIHLSPDGNALFVSNRGHDNLARFAVNFDTGHLELKGYTPTDHWPRVFAITANNHFVYVAGRDTCRICCYRFESNGNLKFLESYSVGMRTMWIEPRLIK